MKHVHPLIAEILARQLPFSDTESLLAAGGDPGDTPVEECVHSWFRVSGADRYRCCHCGCVSIFSSEP